MVKHVVEVADVGDADPVFLERGLDALGPVLVEGLAQVEGVGHRVQHRLGRDVALGGVQRRRELDVVRVQLARERQPLLDRAVGVGVADRPRGQLLEGRRQDPHLHELGLEALDRHRTHSPGLGDLAGGLAFFAPPGVLTSLTGVLSNERT